MHSTFANLTSRIRKYIFTTSSFHRHQVKKKNVSTYRTNQMMNDELRQTVQLSIAVPRNMYKHVWRQVGIGCVGSNKLNFNLQVFYRRMNKCTT